VPARFWAKVKTVVQAIAVGFALLPPVADHDDRMWIVSTWLWAATVLTVFTGVQYVLEGSRATTTAGVRA
jgi:phosphatidylglycerophosphate synthase